jgi:pyruvate/2-oxoglutarate dehydrogenase complex dihydrolipoamide acyltransferase (E2) component
MGEPILEVMIPGVTCDIPAPAPGTITRLDRPLDATVSPGDVVAWLAPRN